MAKKLIDSLSTLTTEDRNPESMNLDTLGSLQLATLINQQDKLVPLAIEKELPQIARAIDVITAAFQNNGRLLYIGAGTSGRLGILDASECPPTFGVNVNMVTGIISGGVEAVFRSIESAEDSAENGKQDLINHCLCKKDVVVGIAASGRTPYVIGALTYARSIGARSIALSCNARSEIARLADIAISPVVGPEVLTGSTRMKSGTAQKLVLNMLSTASMVKLGKCYQNLMIDVQTSNEKLSARAVRIVMQATGCRDDEAADALYHSGYDVKTAILMQLTGLPSADARAMLADNNGHLSATISRI